MNAPRLKVLFVCAMNKQRSVTAERLYRNDARLEVRSAGVRAESPRRVSESDLTWADVVFVMEREHKLWITTRFEGLALPPIDVLNIPDDFEVMDPAAAGNPALAARSRDCAPAGKSAEQD